MNIAAPSPRSTSRTLAEQLRTRMNAAIVGQPVFVDRLLLALFANGHILVEGAPGLAKTKAIAAPSAAVDCDDKRIQLTPDLLPGDLTGTEVYRPEHGTFTLQKGPLFHHLILADEINRAPAKVESALFEAMAERQITMGGTTYKLPELFMVMATQNPIEQEGTYPLPEAQLDRFLFKHTLDYPSREEEFAIVAQHGTRTGMNTPASFGIGSVISAADLDTAVDTVSQITLKDDIISYIVDLIRATRETPALETGASPRAAAALATAARARAAIDGRDFVIPDDVKTLALPALRHRILLSPAAEIEGKTTDETLASIIEQTAAPR